VRTIAVIFALLAAALALPGQAHAGVCGLPDSKPLWLDFTTPDFAHLFGRQGVNVAVSSGDFPAQMRERGAKTMYWDMYLNRRVGTPSAPADPATIVDRANRLYDYAAAQTACPTPFIILNELFGAALETPWTPTTAQYRANVLALVRQLASRGARPFLLVSTAPYTGGEAGDWWRQVAQVSDLVREVYFSGRNLDTRGPIAGSRHIRAAMRRAAAELIAIGIPPSKLGFVLGFHSAPGKGGREGLRSPAAWFRTVKWQTMGARQVAGELGIATIWSWGWGTYSEAGRDADKPRTACVYLWSRDPSLCDGPAVAGKDFEASRTEGQLVLPSGAKCTLGPAAIRNDAIARLSVLTGDRALAFSALFRRLVESETRPVLWKDVLAAERRIVTMRFGGSRAAYRAALARSRATVAVGRGIIADELRRGRVSAGFRVSRPGGADVAAYYEAYPEVLVREVAAKAPLPWLGGLKRGLALEPTSPAAVFSAPAGRESTVLSVHGAYAVKPFDEAVPLAALPLSLVRPAIVHALSSFARADRYDSWSVRTQEQAFKRLTCSRDELPVASPVDLTEYLPFLSAI
jgi:hypothetical protein